MMYTRIPPTYTYAAIAGISDEWLCHNLYYLITLYGGSAVLYANVQTKFIILYFRI